jgi:trehalose/maltose transport system substrate-binding protein
MSGEQALPGTRITPHKNMLSRRDFLKLSGMGVAGVTVLLASGCGSGGASTDNVGFTSLDLADSIPRLVDKFNEQNKGKFQAAYRAIELESQEYFDRLKADFQAGGGETDVIVGNVPWTAEFAKNGWITDVTDRFPEGERAEFLEVPINSLIYEGKIYGVPLFTDVGILYYRKDLLEQSGFPGPPKTWDELKEMAKKVVQDSGTRYGFVFQGANNETGVCNGLEYIWTHGGEILDGDRVIIDSPESVAGLDTELSMISEGVTPQAVASYNLGESQAAFVNGDAVFCRNWPYMYGLAGDPEMSKIMQKQVGISQLPVGDGQHQSAGCLGGWNMLVGASSELKDEAWEFVRFMTSQGSQRMQALSALAPLPTLDALYYDREILEEVPVIALCKEALQTARSRPISPYYSQMSRTMAEQFNNVLTGAASPEQAVETLQSDLQQIIERG